MHIYWMSRMKALRFRATSTNSGLKVSTPSQCAIKSSSSARFNARPGFIATKVALLLTVEQLCLTWQIWRIKVFSLHCKNGHLNKWRRKLFSSTFLFSFKQLKYIDRIAYMEEEPAGSWTSLKQARLFWDKLQPISMVFPDTWYT